MTIPAKTTPPGDVMESLLLKGDLGKLTPDERVQYYQAVCKSIGLNPLTKPFEYITLNGKLQLYALRACTDQLRKINNISLEIVSRDLRDDILTVHVRAKNGEGRVDEDLGSVPLPSGLRGEARANAELKAVTKAKRRATLSICGLGWLDETEVSDIPVERKPKAGPDRITTGPPQQQPQERPVETPHAQSAPVTPPHDPETGEIKDPRSAALVNVAKVGDQVQPNAEPEETGDFGKSQPQHAPEHTSGISLHDMAREAAMRGFDVMKQFYLSRNKAEQAEINKIRPELNELVDAAEAVTNEGEGS